MTARRRGGSPRPCHYTVPPNAVLMLGCGGTRSLHLEKQLPLSGGNRYEGRQKPLFFPSFCLSAARPGSELRHEESSAELEQSPARFLGNRKESPENWKTPGRLRRSFFFKFHFIYLSGVRHGSASHHIQDGQIVIQNC